MFGMRPLLGRGTLSFVASAAIVALAIHTSFTRPWLGLLMLTPLAVLAALRLRARRRVRRMVQSGQVEQLVGAWEEAVSDLPHADTMLPLIQATALAASGMTDRARAALERASRGSAWEAALEHRLIVETMLHTFEGDAADAMEKSARLAALPLPDVGPSVRARVEQARHAMAALARAFAHDAHERDAELLTSAARENPLLHWPLRYAAAVVEIDAGRPAKARKLIDSAPEWPEESVFRAYQAELAAHAATPGA